MICGIVDLGSNTIRLSVYRWEGTSFQSILHQKSTAGLAGYVRGGVLSPEGIAAACGVLSRYRALMDNLNIPDLYVFATASLRNISNTAEAVEAIRQRTGIAVEVLSGETEARLSFRGAVPEGGAGLLADIGGGSFELVAFGDGAVRGACSRPIGSLSLFSRYVSGLFLTPAERRAMEVQIAAELEQATIPAGPYPLLRGVGGTVRAADKLAVELFQKDRAGRLTAGEVDELYRRLSTGDRDVLHLLLHAVPDRVHTILPGLAILRGIVHAYGVEEVAVADTGIREGYLMERVMGL